MRSIHPILAALVALAAGTARAESTGLTAGMELIGTHGRAPAIALSTRLGIDVTGLLARTTVIQTFANPGDEWVEGRYVFPLPAGAAVDELRITLGERVIEGAIRERERARQVYADARESGRTAGLVEQHRPGLFSTEIANIAPGEEVEVRLGFAQTVEYAHGRFALRFPTTTLARFANAPAETVASRLSGAGSALRHATATASVIASDPVPGPMHDRHATHRLELVVSLHPGLDIGSLESLHHPVRVQTDGSDRTIELADPAAAAGRDFELVWSPRHRDRLQGALFVEQMLGRAHALLMLVPPEEFRPSVLQRELILVIDRSGSMRGDAFEQAREALRLALDRIDGDDRFNVIAFDDRAQALFDVPVPASPANLNRAYRFVDALAAEGGTQIDRALDIAMTPAPAPGFLRQIVFATDGSVANELQVLELVRNRIDRSRLFAIGIGHGVNDAFLGDLARTGRGTLTRIANVADIAERMGGLLRQLESPVLEDIEVEWPVAAETWPDPTPDLYAGQPLMLLARLDAPEHELDGGAVRATGFRDLHYVEMEWPLKHFRSAPGVARAWARARIDGLGHLPPGVMDEPLRRDEMLLTALDYRILSPLTSLVAVD
ncbi:MAG: VIT domain-containing protein, partial [Wenzhouxiangellaceae bacterium]|nr:VIT domain-containing protein [Wenzhouxiangellaceae bacterium]